MWPFPPHGSQNSPEEETWIPWPWGPRWALHSLTQEQESPGLPAAHVLRMKSLGQEALA